MFLNNIWIVYPFRCYTIYIINNKKMRLKNKSNIEVVDDRVWPLIGSMVLSCDNIPDIEYGGNSKEKREQQLRETSTLQVLFGVNTFSFIFYFDFIYSGALLQQERAVRPPRAGFWPRGEAGVPAHPPGGHQRRGGGAERLYRPRLAGAIVRQVHGLKSSAGPPGTPSRCHPAPCCGFAYGLQHPAEPDWGRRKDPRG